jgi:hypothetical protein
MPPYIYTGENVLVEINIKKLDAGRMQYLYKVTLLKKSI